MNTKTISYDQYEVFKYQLFKLYNQLTEFEEAINNKKILDDAKEVKESIHTLLSDLRTQDIIR